MYIYTRFLKSRKKILKNLTSYHFWVVGLLVICCYFFLISNNKHVLRYNKKVLQTTQNSFEKPRTHDQRPQGKQFRERERQTHKKQEVKTMTV